MKKGSANYYREVFVSTKLGDRLVEGFIDLLIDAPDGITIVDYKTDRLTTKQVQELGPEYEVQMGLYAWAVGETTGSWCGRRRSSSFAHRRNVGSRTRRRSS